MRRLILSVKIFAGSISLKGRGRCLQGFDLVLNLVSEEKINEARISEITDFTLSAYPFDEFLKEHLCKNVILLLTAAPSEMIVIMEKKDSMRGIYS